MYDAQQAIWDDRSYYFIIQEEQPEGGIKLSLRSRAISGCQSTILSFDSEADAALYLLAELRQGARISEEDSEIARAILRGDRAMFLSEEKRPDGTLLLSLHNDPAPTGS